MNLTTSYTNPIFEMNGYEPKTTFWTDFSIADMFGTGGVKDTYNRTLCSLYADLWCNIEDFIYEHFKDNEEAISYYQRVTD